MPSQLPPTAALTVIETMIEAWNRHVGRRHTDARRTILAAITTLPDFFDVEQLCGECCKLSPPVSRATVYRTMPLLCEAGILRATEFGDGHQRYCRQAPGAIPTAEIFVVDCGKIISVPAPFLTWYAEAVTGKAGYKLVSQRLQTFARCHHKDEADSCQRCARGDAHRQTHGHAISPKPLI